jgi:short-subunit dehydrogenase
MDFNKQVIVLTGATGGLGQAIAILMAAQGAQLLLVARNKQRLSQLAQLLGDNHQWLSVDITSSTGRAAMIAKAQACNANILINSAGASQFVNFCAIEQQQLHNTMALNLIAPMCLTQDFLQMPNQTEAKTIVNIGSVLGSIGCPFYTSYCASKFGLRGFSEALQRELSHSENRVLYFAPRATDTQINSKAARVMKPVLGNQVDDPELVALALVNQLIRGDKRKLVGCYENFIAHFNGLFPKLIDKAMARKLPQMRQFHETK